MESRRQDLLTVTGLITGENSLPIPIDLIFDIFSRLSAKSIARCRCVSKFWASILRLPDFTELFLTKSSARPQLLVTCKGRGQLFLFTLPQLQHSDENASIVVAANQLTRFPFEYESSEIFGPLRGLICRSYLRIVKGRKETLPVICNPSTGQTLKLPKLKTRLDRVRSFLGYDPIGKQFKLLSTTWSFERGDDESTEYQVLTLGTKKLSWRKVECCMSTHYPGRSGICINGSLFYVTWVRGKIDTITCFNFRSEEFKSINTAEDMTLESDSTLVNYNGKLGVLLQDRSRNGFNLISANTRFIELWVLEDPERHEWSKHIHVLPPLWKTVAVNSYVRFAGMIGMNEIVLSPQHAQSGPFYIYYFNIKKNTIVRVEVQGMDDIVCAGRLTFLNHVENVELMQAI